MAKRFISNLKSGGLGDLTATDALLHPGTFPLGSPVSRAAARAMIRPNELRDGDQGQTEGLYWSIGRDDATGSLRVYGISEDPPDIWSGLLRHGTPREELEKTIANKRREARERYGRMREEVRPHEAASKRNTETTLEPGHPSRPGDTPAHIAD